MKPDFPERAMSSMPAQPCAASNFPAAPGGPMLLPGVIPTDSLFQGRHEILICHNGEHYRLRITKNAKLILTK